MPEYVVFRGVQMSEDWPEQIRAAQTKTTLVIDGKTIRRIPYGRERGWGPGHDRRPCHDCCVLSGELHVPGCDVEQCPSCRNQLISCLCLHDEQERDDEAQDEY